MPQLNPTPLITPGSILVGFANLFLAPLGTTPPAPNKTLGAPWPTGWVNPGSSIDGLTLARDPKTSDIAIEEQSTPVLRLLDTLDFTISTTLSEDTVQNQLWAYGAGTISTVPPTSTLPGYSVLTLSDSINQVMVGFEALEAVPGCARLVVFPIATMVSKVDATYRRAKEQRKYLLTATALCPQASVLMYFQTSLHV